MHARRIALFGLVLVFLISASTAFGSTLDAYKGEPGDIQDEIGEVEEPKEEVTEPKEEVGEEVAGTEPVTEATVTETTTGALPFTGFEAGLIIAGGLGLLALGFTLRRVSRSRA